MISASARWNRALVKAYTSLTFLNSSVEALAFRFSVPDGSTGGGGGGPGLVLVDLRASMICWANSTATCDVDFVEHAWQGVGEHVVASEGGGFPNGFSEEGRWEVRMVGTIFMAAIASAISVTWSSLNMATGGRPGLSGGVLEPGRDIGGWYWTISVGAIVNVEMIDASLYVKTNIYRARRFGKMLEELDAGNYRR
jgi:hypothetical protein